jgi:hypothetical protein
MSAVMPHAGMDEHDRAVARWSGDYFRDGRPLDSRLRIGRRRPTEQIPPGFRKIHNLPEPDTVLIDLQHRYSRKIGKSDSHKKKHENEEKTPQAGDLAFRKEKDGDGQQSQQAQ